MVELWAKREKARAAAEWGEAEARERSGSVVAVDHLRAASGGASESRPIQSGFFLFVVSHTYTEMKKWQSTVTKTVAYLNIYILLTKADATCLPNIGCRCSLVLNIKRQTLKPFGNDRLNGTAGLFWLTLYSGPGTKWYTDTQPLWCIWNRTAGGFSWTWLLMPLVVSTHPSLKLPK